MIPHIAPTIISISIAYFYWAPSESNNLGGFRADGKETSQGYARVIIVCNEHCRTISYYSYGRLNDSLQQIS